MNPDVTSPVPMKDEMGMDYVPVYEQAAGAGGVFISAEKQQMIGVKKAKAEVRDLTGEITTVGRVANDPNLFVAQEEYLQAIKGQATMGKAMPYAGGESEAFKKTAKLRLMLLGMSEEEIAALEKSGKAQQNLYLPTAEDKHIWVYITVYEYEARFVKPGLEVAVETAAMPGRVLSGKIISIGPVVEATTRSLKVRALVENPDNQLKLEMYVNVRIHYDLGEKLCVPEEAVMRLGTRDIVYAAEPNDHFAVREVILGAKAGKYIEVLKGIEPNEAVVTSGNFLIDSETKLRSKI
jgi:Cu(I)/Ag(I) efflux system membrane fusion protein